MPSQIELLQEKVDRLTAKNGADDPFVKDLRQQLASMKSRAAKRAAGLHSPNPVTFSVGMDSDEK
jgi:hypothetical protein